MAVYGGKGIAAVITVQNDSETIEASLKSYYDHVDKILVTTDLKRGWSGVPIVPDNTLDIIRSLDTAGKIEIIESDFYKYDEPMKNDTYQRQFAGDILASRNHWKWILQIDADEVFLDFPSVLRQISPLYFAQFVNWRLIPVFNTLDDGRLLVVTDNEGIPILEKYPLGHRTGAKMAWGRTVLKPEDAIFKIFKWRYEGGKKMNDAVLHYTFAKSEKRIREKLATWGHCNDFDTAAYLSLWLDSKTNWETLKNFNPIIPELWPALRAFTLDELRSLTARKVR